MNRNHRFPCLRAFLIVAFHVGLGTLAALQAASPGFVKIDEKPGAQVAMDIPLRDEDGNRITLGKLIDKPTVLTLNYFRCVGICTPLLNGLAETLNQIGLEPGRNYQVITLSFDPTDTAEIAHQKRINYLQQIKRPFPLTAWRFLTGDAGSTRSVADSVGFGYRAEGDQYIHPAAIMLLTPEGKVSRYLYGITFLPADLRMAIQEAASGRSNPPIPHILTYCYTYDSARGIYVLNFTRIIGAGTLIVIGLFVILVSRRRSGGRNKEKLPEQGVFTSIRSRDHKRIGIHPSR